MSSKWTDRISQALGLRLAAWYLGTFLASTLVIGGLTYGLLASLLETRDHDIIQSTLREYATRYQAGGLPALARAIEIEQRSGSREPLFVRLVGPFEDVLLYSLPETWGAFDLSELPGGPNAIWSQVRSSDRNAVLEVATIDVGGGSVLQVGKTSEARNQLLSNFRRVLMLGAGFALVIGVVGGLFLTRSTLKPLRDLRDAVRRILQTGQTDDRVPVYGTEDAVDELSGALQRHARAHHDADPRHAQRARSRRARSAHADDAPARHRRIGAGDQRSGQASRGAVRLPRGIRARAVDADDVDGHLGSRDRHDEAERDRGRRSAQLATEVVDLYEDTAEDAGVTLASTCRPISPCPPIAIDCARRSPTSSTTRSSTRRAAAASICRQRADGDAIVIRVADTGRGISEQDLPRIFDRLYRGDQSRATRGLGTGAEPRPRLRRGAGRHGVGEEHARKRLGLRDPPAPSVERP